MWFFFVLGETKADLFPHVLFSFLPPLLATPLPLLFSAPFCPSLPLEECSVERRAQHRTWRRGNFRMDISTQFGKEAPSRNLRENGSESIMFLLALTELCAGWPRFGSVRLRFGVGTVRAVPVFGSRGSSKAVIFVCVCVSVQFHREDGSGSGFGSWKTVPTVPVPRSVPAKTVPTVPVSGSGSVPGPRRLWRNAH